MMLTADRELSITERQQALGPRPASPRTQREYLQCARWWELEAGRGYASSRRSIRYGQNMRWASELAAEFGPGTWLELLQRSGRKNPEPA